MKLNLDFYKENEEMLERQEKPFFEDLVDSSKNILNWYPFEKQDTVLEVGGNFGQLTSVFTEQCKNVVTIEPSLIKAKEISKKYEQQDNLEIIVGNLKNINIDKKFNYIILIGVINRVEQIAGENIKLTELIKKLEPYLLENGKFLIAVDNQFGLRYFVGNAENILNKKFVGINAYHNESKKIETFTKVRLERKLKEIGYCANFYYPLPDYKLPNVIFSDKQLPKYNNIDKYIPYGTDESAIIMDEIDVFREILKDNEEMFPFFANSFLMEVSKNNTPIKYKYISFNNCRKAQYRLITKIADDYVEKQVTGKESENHYENIKKNIKKLEERNIKTLDYEEEGKILSKYCNQEFLVNNVITESLDKNNQEMLEKVMNRYLEVLYYDTYTEEDYEKTVFGKYKIDIENPELIKELHFQKQGLWDMTFKNCFYIDGDIYFFDQEWNEPNLPVEYILYRSILYTISLRRFINIEDWFEKFGLTKYKTMFEKLDEKLQEEIRDDKIWEFYHQNHNFSIDETKQEVINLNMRRAAQELAMEELKKENAQLKQKNASLQETLDNQLLNKLRLKIKKIVGEKSDE